jgi:hypothetical protein
VQRLILIINAKKNIINDLKIVDTGRGVPEVIILDPAGLKTTVPVKLRQISPDLWRCEYVSPELGLHSVNVFFAGQPIPDSPFGVRVSAGMLGYFVVLFNNNIYKGSYCQLNNIIFCKRINEIPR